jgi:chromosome segregation ATPase
MSEADARAQKARDREATEISDLKGTMAELERRLKRSQEEHAQDLQTAHEEYMSKEKDLEARLKRAESRLQDAETRAQQLHEEVDKEKAARKDVQTELDDLLVVFGDLEAKRSADKQKLKDLGQEVSEDEDEEGDAEGGDESDNDVE